MSPVSRTAPSLWARLAGLSYFLNIAVGVAGEYLARSVTIVSGDAAATARNILSSEQLFRLGTAADLISTASYIGVTAFFYVLFKPVSRSVSMLAALFSLIGLAVSAANTINNAAPLAFLKGAHYLSTFTPAQLQTLAYAFLKLHTLGSNIGIVFFGFYCFLVGYLILRSTFLPRALGVLMVFAGMSWLLDSFATILSPALSTQLSFAPIVVGITGEGLLTLWLLLFGVNAVRWRKQAGEISVAS